MPGRLRQRDEESNPSSSKRPRYEPSKGAIVKIRLHNFMTYKDVEIVPGPRLNLVLGPNGTGKSTLVNAICLGLAGSTGLLGRADNVRDFVRRGESEAFIQIWLSIGRPGCTVCIKRNLKARENASEWRINGESVTLREVKERVKQLHVQLDNLCQFLPQDKVVEFARLKPDQLLAETEKAVGDSSLYDLHQELIKERNALKGNESAMRVSQHELDLLERQNEGLKREVHRVEQRSQLEKEVLHLEDKLEWTKFKTFREHHHENLGEYQLNEERFANMQAKQEEEEQPMRDKEERQEAAAKEAKTSLDKLKKLEEDIGEVKEKLDKMIEDADDKHVKLESLDEEHAKWQAEIAKLTEEVQGLEAELSQVPESQPSHASQAQAGHATELRRLDAERREVVNTVRGLQHQADLKREEHESANQELVAYHEQMRRLMNVKVQRLRLLESGFRGITALTHWLEQPQAKSMFKGKVFGPILCEVTVDSPQNAAWLEQHCPKDLWARFVTQYQEDQDRLGREASTRFNFRPIITNFSGNSEEVIRHRNGDSVNFAGEGVTNTLDEVFQAPQTIKLAMCNEAMLNETYCGNRTLNAEAFLEQNPDITRLLTPESVYVIRKSKYNPAARSMNVSAMRPATLLAPSGASNVEDEKLALQAKIEEANRNTKSITTALTALEADIKEEEGRANGLQTELERIQGQIHDIKYKRQKLGSALKQKQKTLQKAQDKPDPRSQAPALQKEIKDLCTAQCKLIARLTGMHAELLDLSKQQIVAEASSRELAAQVKAMERAARERTNRMRHLDSLMKDMKEGIETEKVQLAKLKKNAIDRTGPMSDEIRERFAKLPSDKENIEELIRAKIAEMDGIHLANPRALEEYTQRKKEIDKLTRTYTDQQEGVATARAIIDTKKGQWLPELKRIIAEVNRNFGQSFARIGCAGEVELYEEIDSVTQQEDFERYAIHIKVRFRAEEGLQLLTSQRQSGGERSVSTILYLIAIQNVTVCPFRVVDEINQGMDPINERKVFMQLAEAACQPHTPQCFLLTPKLLPELPFSEHTTLLEIYNGPLITSSSRGINAAKLVGGRTPTAAVAA